MVNPGNSTDVLIKSDIDSEEISSLHQLIIAHTGRVRILELKAAKYGLSCPPEIEAEIEEIKDKISALKRQLGNNYNSSLINKTPAQTKNIRLFSYPLIFLFIGLSLILGSFLTWLWVQYSSIQETFSNVDLCNQISITPEVKRISMAAPLEEDTYAGVNYELKAPSATGTKVLFHKAQHLINDGARNVEIVMGRHFSHADVYIPAGKSTLLSDGVLLGKYDIEYAQKYRTALITQRLTFSVVSDQGIYCEKTADIEIEMTGLK